MVGVNALAYRMLPPIEEALACRPSDAVLWGLWLDFARPVGRLVTEVLPAVVPSPMATTEVWPPVPVLIQASVDLKRLKRWQDLVDLLQPRMKAKRNLAEPGPAAGGPAMKPPNAKEWNWILNGSSSV